MAENAATAVVPPRGLEYTDTDGTVMEWDPKQKAYFPKVSSELCTVLDFVVGTRWL